MPELDTLNIQLYNLKKAFDQAIIHGSCFSNVKEIYIQIKELEKRITEQASKTKSKV